MTQPILNNVPNYDANNSYTFTFTYLGASMTTTNQLSIREDRQDSQPVYQKEQISLDKNHILSPKILNNGVNYLAKIRVKLDNGYSDWSPEIKFTCFDTPKIYFDTIDQHQLIYTDDVLMSAIYTQKQNEPVKDYQYTLYDQRHVTLKEYPVRVPTVASPTRFSERVSDLQKGKLYYIGLKVRTEHGIIYEQLQEFTAQYVAPSISGAVQPKLNKDEGQITVELFMKQLLGTSARAFIPNRKNDAPTHYTYWKDDYVVIPKENPLMFTKLGMAKARGWIAKVWCMNVQDGTFLEFAPAYGNEGQHIKFVKNGDFVTCEKEFGRVKYRTRSNVIPNLGLRPFFMFIKVSGGYRVEVTLQPDLTYQGDDKGDSQKSKDELAQYGNVTQATKNLIDAQQAKISAAISQMQAGHDYQWQQYAGQVQAIINNTRAGNYSHDEMREKIQEIDDKYWEYFNRVEMGEFFKRLKDVMHDTEAYLSVYRDEYISRCREVLMNVKGGSVTLNDARMKLNSYNTVYSMVLREVINFNTPVLSTDSLVKVYNDYVKDYKIDNSALI